MTTTTSEIKPIKYSASEEAFALFLFQGLDQCEAYRRAYPDWKSTSANALYVQASRKAAHPKIRLRVAELQAKAESATIGTVVERKQRLTDIYRANLVDFLDEDGQVKFSRGIPHHAAVSEYSVTTLGDSDGEVVTKRSLKLRDPVAAIQEQNKMERIGQVDTAININNDNRSVTIVVASEKGRLALESLKSGKLPQLQGKMVGQ